MAKKGKLTIFLGYAAGVGKTYLMLEQAQALKSRGVDVVIGYFEPHGRKDTIAKTEGLEMIPRKKVAYRGSFFEEMDSDAILARHPQVAVVDEFPHTNVPGSAREKRWEDVLALLEEGIDVLSTMNVQHLESLNDQMAQITGVKVRETIPDWVVKQADDVVMVDLTPRALLNRLERGVVYPAEKAQRALQNFFKESTLVALREMALRQTAHEVEERMEQDEADAEAALNGDGDKEKRRLNDAVIIYLSDDPSTAMLIRRGKRVADVTHADCFAVFITENGDVASLPQPKRDAVERLLHFARNLHINTRIISSNDHAKALVEFAREQKARQIFLPRVIIGGGMERLRGKSLVNQVVSMADDMEVTIVAERRVAK